MIECNYNFGTNANISGFMTYTAILGFRNFYAKPGL
jgi:hypothetical protein